MKYTLLQKVVFIDLYLFELHRNLEHSLDQLKIIQINLDLKEIAIGYQINYPAVWKPS